jgi:hypothetical protein
MARSYKWLLDQGIRPDHVALIGEMADKKIIDRLNEIAALYDELAAGQDPGPTDRE